MSKDKEVEVVDIGKEAQDLTVFSDGDLERLDQEKGIEFKWFKEKSVILLGGLIIVCILAASLLALIYGDDEVRDWSKQILGTLLGFAAGAVFSAKRSSGN